MIVVDASCLIFLVKVYERRKKGWSFELMAAPMNLVLSVCFTTAATFIAAILLLLPPSATCFTQPPSPSPSSDDPSKGQELLIEEKTRLGSRPPSCHNKCNECHPCMAVQAPTLPKRVPTQSRDTIPAAAAEADDVFHSESSSSGCNNRYSNYKPLGWKCRCRNHFYNP